MLMVRKWLSYILVMLIALQSVVAVADAHQAHQSAMEHLEFEHEHDVNADIEAPVSDLAQDDCHHCCHCHGVEHLYIVGSGADFSGKSLHRLIAHGPRYYSKYSSPDIRPPIV